MSDATTPETNASSHDDELWLVKLADGSVRPMTVDAMSAAFDAGELSASTEVQAPDGEGWTTLAVVAGLDEAGDASPEVPAPATNEATLAAESVSAPEPAHVSAPASRDSSPPASSASPSLAPMVASIAPPSEAAFLADRISTLPEVDLDSAEAQLRAGKRRMAFTMAAVAVGVVVCGVAVSYVTGRAPEAPPAAAAKVQDVAPPPAAVDPATAFDKPQLTEEQKKRLADADKARNAKKAGAAAPHGASGGGSPTKPSKDSPFHQGGDKYDPLNGSL
ncbi:MAG: hypothetical protein JNM74_16640 [Myxococcales bacterium]|nr:hypothetical protein [Myxococcales bacterium]